MYDISCIYKTCFPQAMSRELEILEKLKMEYTQNNMEQVIYDVVIQLIVENIQQFLDILLCLGSFSSRLYIPVNRASRRI